MKKILIAVGALGVMSFTTNQVIDTWLLSEAVNNRQDMKEWMEEDISNGKMNKSVASDYLDVLDETEDLLMQYNDYINLASYRLNTNE